MISSFLRVFVNVFTKKTYLYEVLIKLKANKDLPPVEATSALNGTDLKVCSQRFNSASTSVLTCNLC
jgi:hypothetical protein